MDKKDIRRYNELNDKTTHTEAEKAEFELLEAKFKANEEAETIAKGVKDVLSEIGLTKEKVDSITVSKGKEEVGKDNVMDLLSKNGEYRMSMLVVTEAAKLRGGDNEFKKRYGMLPVEMTQKLAEFEKAAQPQTEGTAADGGILVPTITQARILELVPTYGQARQHMQSFPMSGNVQKIPKELTNPTAYWVDEASQITDSKLTLEDLTLTPKKLAAIVTASNEVLMDARPDLGAYIVKKIAQAFGIAEDTQMFKGTGTPFTGVYNTANTFGGNTLTTPTTDPASLTYGNILAMTAAVDQNFVTGAAYYAHRSIMPYIWGLMDDQNRPIFSPAWGSNPATIFGYPVYWIENAPTYAEAAATPLTPFILFGDLTNTYIGDVMGMTVKVFEEGVVDGTSLIENDLTGIRVIKRVAFNKGLVAKYSVLRTHA